MLDIRLKSIVSKAAGVYFIVTDNSTVRDIEEDPKLRLYFINVPDGPFNNMVKFGRGDTDSFTAVFGKPTRAMEKKGNFSHRVCLDALQAGPIAVVNLRKFDNNKHKVYAASCPPNTWGVGQSLQTAITELYDRNGFWVPKSDLVSEKCFPVKGDENDSVFNFGNISNSKKTVFVTRATDDEVSVLTDEGNNTLETTVLEIEEYAGLDFNLKVKDTFVTVYVFNADLSSGAGKVIAHPKYGNLFTSKDGNTLTITRENLKKLARIPESGFINKYVGSLIPNLISENNDALSIDTIMYQEFIKTGLLCDINDDLLDVTIDPSRPMIETAHNYFKKYVEYLTAHGSESDFATKIPKKTGLSTTNGKGLLVSIDAAGTDTITRDVYENNVVIHSLTKETDTTYTIVGKLEIPKVTTYLYGEDGLVEIKSIKHEENSLQHTWKTTITTAGPVTIVPQLTIYDTVTSAPKQYDNVAYFLQNDFEISPLTMGGYVATDDQFLDGTVKKQNEILDMINSKSVIKGLKGVPEIRYIVDTFKSFVVPDYKYQFGRLMNTMHENNKFISCIVNEPFISDLTKSTNPLFKSNPTEDSIDYSYLATGGNQEYSSISLTKFEEGADKTFFAGPENMHGVFPKPVSGIVSNLMYQKTAEYDIAANSTGYVSGINSLSENFDDNDRIALEKFRYNPIIKDDRGYTLFGNMSGQKKLSKQSQWHNVELLCYIKRNLYQIGRYDAFRKGTYDDYLRTQTEVQDFMDSLVLAGAIKPNPTVICDTTNNTPEVASYKIKIIKVGYVPYDSLEKVVFDIEINKD